MKVIIFSALFLVVSLPQMPCKEGVQIKAIRQERYNGCGKDFIGADMRVVFRLTNKANHPIYVFGFRSEDFFMPTGYVLKLNRKSKEWQYPTGDNKPVSWTERGDMDKSMVKLEPGEFIEFDACYSFMEKGETFGRSVYIACPPSEAPIELISEEYKITSPK
jgi:hypothetical protein